VKTHPFVFPKIWKKDRDLLVTTVDRRYAEFQKTGSKHIEIDGLPEKSVGQRRTLRGEDY
jgi:hypothetical protein